MRSKENRSRELRALCAEPHPDDGVDPRRAFTREAERQASGTDRKTRQLCKQAERALRAALGGEVADEGLRLLDVVGVEPAPDASRLRVIVRAPHDDGSTAEWSARLQRAAGFLRSRVAHDITRKRAPELTFSVERSAAEGDA
jgi:ribosome-binding factor A